MSQKNLWCRKLVSGTMFVGTGVALLFTSGCTLLGSKDQPLLAPRNIIPPPYVAPAQTDDASDDAMAPAANDDFPMPDTEPLKPLADDKVEDKDVAPVKEDQIVLPPAVKPVETITYVVQKNDSFWKIAKKYGVNFKELAEYNKMKLDAMLHPGQKITIPPGGHLVAPAKKATPAKSSSSRNEKTGKPTPKKSSSSSSADAYVPKAKKPIPADGKYYVKNGDNLWVISRRYGVSIKQLKELNSLKSNSLRIGQTLILKDSGAATSMPAEPAYKETTLIPDTTTDLNLEPSATDLVVPDTTTAETIKIESFTPSATTDVVAPTVTPVITTSYPNELQCDVNAGDTLEIIADMYGSTVEKIKQANPGIKSNADLKPGMQLKVPYNNQ